LAKKAAKVEKELPLMWLCKTPGGWKRYPVLMAKNGRVRTSWVMVDGKEEHYPEGRFQIRVYKDGKRTWENAGNDATDALNERARLSLRREAEAKAAAAGTTVVEEKGRIAIRPATTRYLQRCEDLEAEQAAISYGVALNDFMRLLPDIKHVDQIDESVMVRFGVALRRAGNSARTVFNKHRSVLGFLRWLDIDVKALKIRTPKYEKKVPVVYSEETVAALLKAAPDTYFRDVLSTLRMSGLREQEAVHLVWPDIDFKRKLILVRSKPEQGFEIKDREQRDVPLPDALAVILKARFEERGASRLVLGTKGDKPHQKWLRLLKRTARSAGLNCGRCDSCRTQKECELFTLHSFRRTYATALHRKGVDVRTLMDLLGHADLETTLNYLAAMKAEASHAQVNAAFA
jgi:integrase